MVVIDNLPKSLRPLAGAMDGKQLAAVEFQAELERHHFQSNRDEMVEAAIRNQLTAFLASFDSDEPQGSMVAVVGAPGAGKSWAIRRALTMVLGDNAGVLLCLKAASPCTLKLLGVNILNALGYEIRRDLREYLVWDRVREQLPNCGKHLVWIDEMHHVLSSRHDGELDKISETLKNTMQLQSEDGRRRRGAPINFILSGRGILSHFVGRDEQIERRSATVEFKRLDLTKHCVGIREIITTVIVDHAAMTMAPEVASEAFVHRVFRAVDGAFGSTITMTRRAVLNAFHRAGPGATVTGRDFAAVYRLWRNCEADQNIFLVDDWTTVIPSNARRRDDGAMPSQQSQGAR